MASEGAIQQQVDTVNYTLVYGIDELSLSPTRDDCTTESSEIPMKSQLEVLQSQMPIEHEAQHEIPQSQSESKSEIPTESLPKVIQESQPEIPVETQSEPQSEIPAKTLSESSPEVQLESSDSTPPVASPVESSPLSSITSSSTPIPSSSTVVPTGGIVIEGIHYLGSSTVDAPVSETEANRKMSILKNQAAQSIPITLCIPENNAGSIILRDPSSDQVLVAFFIRYVLFCARGQQETDLYDCIALNVLHKRSGVYHCHVFRCDQLDAVSFIN